MSSLKPRLTRFAAMALAIAALAIAAPSARAQVDPTASPIVVRQQMAKARWMKAEVIHADHRELVVREAANQMAVHTFTYAPKAAQQIEKAIALGGYQRGDAIKIQCEPGKNIALDIKGKPSRPI
ncbi:MAG TPA: hypothetical protein VEJ39_02035 [Candidatus Acidoferrales bacterium]|nr:hypothetical protein [Candidatus Acidoferrales bacterium]